MPIVPVKIAKIDFTSLLKEGFQMIADLSSRDPSDRSDHSDSMKTRFN